MSYMLQIPVYHSLLSLVFLSDHTAGIVGL